MLFLDECYGKVELGVEEFYSNSRVPGGLMVRGLQDSEFSLIERDLSDSIGVKFDLRANMDDLIISCELERCRLLPIVIDCESD